MPTPERERKIRRAVAQRQKGLTVVIEDMQEPHNAMAIVRSCEAFGVIDVHFIFHETKPFDPRRVGASTSATANKWVSYQIWNSTEACLHALKKDGWEVVATVLSDRATSILETDLSQDRVAICIGNERDGLSEMAQKMADRHVMIPMRGMVQSLNVSVSGALFLYEVTRQRMANQDRFTLTEQEQEGLVQDFFER